MKRRILQLLCFGAGSSALFGLLQACGTDETVRHPGILGDGGGSGGSAARTDGGPTGSGGSHVVKSGPIGKACTADADCGGKLVCIKPSGTTIQGAGPANGVCSFDCSNGDDTTCQAIDPNSVCVGMDRTSVVAYCFEACTQGVTPVGETKCHGRKDMACLDTGFCNPTCRGDFDCAPRKCDLATGLCTDPDKLVGGTLPIGTKCDPRASKDNCVGGCLAITQTEGICTGSCEIGQIGCGLDPNSTAPLDAFCEWQTSSTAADGDLGFCGQLCDCDGDCRNPDFVCETFSSTFRAQFGRAGACSPAKDLSTDASVPGTPCKPTAHGDAGADASAGGSTGSGGSTAGSGGKTGSGGTGNVDASPGGDSGAH